MTQAELDEQLKRGSGFTSSVENARYNAKSNGWLREALKMLDGERELSGMLALSAEDQQRIVGRSDERSRSLTSVPVCNRNRPKAIEEIAQAVGKGTV